MSPEIKETLDFTTLVDRLINAGSDGYTTDVFTLRNLINSEFKKASGSTEETADFSTQVDSLIDVLNEGYESQITALRTDVIARYNEVSL
jgi:predicted HAD superfamily Cof-like phosphohydrolase